MQQQSYLRRFFAEVAATAPWRSALVVLLLAVSSLFEGLALAMLFPLLAVLGFVEQGGVSDIAARVDEVLAGFGIPTNIYSIGILLVAMVLLQHFSFLIQAWLAAGLEAGFNARWRRQLTQTLLTSEWLYFTKKNAGELAHIINLETRRAAYLIDYGTQIVSLCLTATVYFVVAFAASWKVTLILVLGGACVLLLSHLLVRHPGRVSARQTHLFGRFAGKSAEIMGGMKLIRAMSGSEAVRQSLWPMITDLQRIERKIYFYPDILRSCFEISALVALMGALVFATKVLGSDGATVLLIAALFMRLYPRISTIQQLAHHFRMALPYYRTVVDTLDEARNAEEKNLTPVISAPEQLTPPALAIVDLCVGYGDRPALQHVTLAVPSRHTVAIVGPSGAGKSTLVDTLLQLVPIESGRIEVDGRDLKEIDLSAWRRSIGYVPQDTFLFNATIRENIAFANPDATTDDIREAARKAHLSAFIDSLPDGMDTEVGDRGVLLSGGQRQRVGLARALLGGKTLLILDEATSALDSKTEAAIMEDIAALHRQITIVIVAHRLSTLRSADKIFVLDQGRVVESGTWQTLMAGGGLFEKLWNMQTEIPRGPEKHELTVPGAQ